MSEQLNEVKGAKTLSAQLVERVKSRKKEGLANALAKSLNERINREEEGSKGLASALKRAKALKESR